METYKPEHLQAWTTPRDYCGAEWYGYYSSGVGRSRDSGSVHGL